MTDAADDDSALAAATGAAGPDAETAFALLGHETRLAILLALWEHYEPHAADTTVPFSDIYEYVEYHDPGSLRYHLERLEGHFIDHHSDGYELRRPGLRFVQVVVAGVGGREDAFGDREIEQACPFCGGRTAIRYRDGLVVHRCTDCDGVTAGEDVPGFLSAVPFDPAGLADRAAPEVRAASRVAAWRQTQVMFDGLCPACSGPVEGWLDCCRSHDPEGLCGACGTQFPVWARFQCRVCKNHTTASPKALAVFHPAVVAFYHRHGLSTRVRADDVESVHRVFDLMDDHELELRVADPPRATVTATCADAAVRVTFDEAVRVVDVQQ